MLQRFGEAFNEAQVSVGSHRRIARGLSNALSDEKAAAEALSTMVTHILPVYGKDLGVERASQFLFLLLDANENLGVNTGSLSVQLMEVR